MDPALADLVKSVSMEAITVLGPAIITAFATFGVTRWQFKGKLQEIARTQEFNARQNLFDYYKNRQVKLSEGYKELSNTLGQILGMAAAGEDNSDTPNQLIDSVAGIAGVYTGIAPFDIDIACRDMAAKELQQTEEYAKLIEYQRTAKDIADGRTISQIRSNVLSLLEIYGFLERCNQLVLEKQMESLFSKYVKSA